MIEKYKLELKTPVLVLEFINKKEHSYKPRFVSYTQKIKGKWVQRIFGLKWNRSIIKEYQECVRIVQGYNEILIKNIDFTSMGGYIPIFGVRKRMFYQTEQIDEFLIEETNLYPKSTYELNTDDIFKKIKYFSKEDYMKCNVKNLIEFLEVIENMPQVEMLFKLDMHHFLNQRKKINFNGKNFLQKFGFSREWYENNKYSNEKNISVLRNAYKLNINIKEYKEYLKFKRETKYKEFNYKYYLKLVNNNLENIYKDLIHIEIQLQKNIKEDYWKYPNLNKIIIMHDKLTDDLNKLKRKITMQENRKYIVERKKEIRMYRDCLDTNINGINFIIPVTKNDIVEEGKNLSHCVGGDSYITKHLKKSIIVFARVEKNKSLETIEIDMKTKNIIQCRGKNNKYTKHHNEILMNANLFIEKLIENEKLNNINLRR